MTTALEDRFLTIQTNFLTSGLIYRSESIFYYCPHISAGTLLAGMGDLLDEYANPITAENGRKFSAFHAAVTSGYPTPDQIIVISRLSTEQIMQCTKHFIVFQTLKGLKTLMGENTLRYVPQRSHSSFDRIHRLLEPKQP